MYKTLIPALYYCKLTNLSSKTIKLSWQPILFSAMFAMGASQDQETLLNFIGILWK